MTSHDTIDRTCLVKRIVDAVGCLLKQGASENLMIAGPWGSGKTTILRSVMRTLSSKEGGKTTPAILTFSPWEQFHDGDARLEFLRQLAYEAKRLGELGTSRPALAERHSLFGTLARVGIAILEGTRLSVTVPGVANVDVAFDKAAEAIRLSFGMESNSDKDGCPDATLPQPMVLRATFRRLLHTIASAHYLLNLPASGDQKNDAVQHRPIVLMIDDMDRARPEQAIDLMDMLYHFLLSRTDLLHEEEDGKLPVISLWAINVPVLTDLLYERYRNLPSFDPYAYIERMFGQRFHVAPLTRFSPNIGDISPMGAVLKDIIVLKGRSEPFESAVMDRLCKPDLLKAIEAAFDYEVLGNLRLFKLVALDCISYWHAITLLSSGSPKYKKNDKDYIDILCYTARLVALVRAFPGFRERVVYSEAMFRVFAQAATECWYNWPRTPIVSPNLRYADNSSLLTLLDDLRVLKFSGGAVGNGGRGAYVVNEANRQVLACELLGMNLKGY